MRFLIIVTTRHCWVTNKNLRGSFDQSYCFAFQRLSPCLQICLWRRRKELDEGQSEDFSLFSDSTSRLVALSIWESNFVGCGSQEAFEEDLWWAARLEDLRSRFSDFKSGFEHLGKLCWWWLFCLFPKRAFWRLVMGSEAEGSSIQIQWFQKWLRAFGETVLVAFWISSGFFPFPKRAFWSLVMGSEAGGSSISRTRAGIPTSSSPTRTIADPYGRSAKPKLAFSSSQYLSVKVNQNNYKYWDGNAVC